MVLHLARGLKERNHALQVICLKSSGPMADLLQAGGIEVIAMKTPARSLAALFDAPRLLRELKAALKKFEPDIVQSFLTRANVLTRMAARDLGIPCVVCSVRVMEKEKRFHLWAERLCLRENALFTVNSKRLKEFAMQEMGLKSDQIHVIPNGIEPTRSVPDRELSEIRNQMGLDQPRLILSAGRLHRQKGFDILLQAFRPIAERYPDVGLLIAGEGEERAALEQQIRAEGLEGRARLIGLVKDISPYLRLAQLFVLSSRWEGTPNVVLESMMAGCPVVATQVGGVSEILSDPKEGWLVPPEDVMALKEGIEKAIMHPDESGLRARQAQAKAKIFSMSQMVGAYEALYQQRLSVPRL